MKKISAIMFALFSLCIQGRADNCANGGKDFAKTQSVYVPTSDSGTYDSSYTSVDASCQYLTITRTIDSWACDFSQRTINERTENTCNSVATCPAFTVTVIQDASIALSCGLSYYGVGISIGDSGGGSYTTDVDCDVNNSPAAQVGVVMTAGWEVATIEISYGGSEWHVVTSGSATYYDDLTFEGASGDFGEPVDYDKGVCCGGCSQCE